MLVAWVLVATLWSMALKLSMDNGQSRKPSKASHGESLKQFTQCCRLLPPSSKTSNSVG